MSQNRQSKVLILSLLYNSSRFLDGYFTGLANINYPTNSIEVHLLDNNSKDKSYELANKLKCESKIKVNILKSKKNLGFSGGNNVLFNKLMKREDFDYFFLLNIDTRINSNCISILVDKMEQDPSCGMIEARQQPKEHPKYYDPKTFETGWCSGGGVLIRKSALEKVGIFDHKFFLYSEDVDLSWRMWLHGFTCKTEPSALYTHFTEGVDEKRDTSVQQYYNFRNSFFMHWKYDSWKGLFNHYKRCVKTYKIVPDKKSKNIFLKAILNSILYLPLCIIDRIKYSRLPKNKWIYFNAFDYEKRREFKDQADGTRIIYNKLKV